MREKEKFFGKRRDGDWEKGKGELKEKPKMEKATAISFSKALEEFGKGELVTSKIGEKGNEIYFEFKGGGKEIFEKAEKIFKQYSQAEGIDKILKENFGIELDGDKKCFRVIFRIPKERPELKEEAKRVLQMIKQELII